MKHLKIKRLMAAVVRADTRAGRGRRGAAGSLKWQFKEGHRKPQVLVAIEQGIQKRRQPTVRQLANRRVQNDCFSPPLYHCVKNLHSFSRLGS